MPFVGIAQGAVISIFCHRCHMLMTIAIKCVVFRIEFVRNFTAVGASDHSALFASLSRDPMWSERGQTTPEDPAKQQLPSCSTLYICKDNLG